MIDFIYKVLLCIHVPFGMISLILFWIPIAVKKGSTLHRKVGWAYFVSMWMVLLTSFWLCICNIIMHNYMAALFLGYLTLITSYPMWYSYEILQQKKEWSDRYWSIRKVFLCLLFSAGLGMVITGAFIFQFQGMGVMMFFFGALVLPSGRDLLWTRDKAMTKEAKLKMHIQGTIISGIAAYTAFFALGGSRVLMDMLHLSYTWMIAAWITPSILGIGYSWYMKRKYRVVAW